MTKRLFDKMAFAHSEDSDQTGWIDQAGHPPSLIRVFAVRFLGSQGPNDSSSVFIRTGKTLINQTGRMCRLIRVFAHMILFVLSCGGS